MKRAGTRENELPAETLSVVPVRASLRYSSCSEAVNMRFIWFFAVVMACLAASASTSPAPRPDNFFKIFEGIMDRIQEAVKNARPAVDVVMNARELVQGGHVDVED
ncbi:Cecropin-D [Eumeta japonica]|uniref:Cecropin-D n=1 Tax=Eumeta variegata TaxID=151549 RepID=A0A4C1WLF7_EUMVA|nr:Cecropin-D [Eumeta japonica]